MPTATKIPSTGISAISPVFLYSISIAETFLSPLIDFGKADFTNSTFGIAKIFSWECLSPRNSSRR